MSSDVAFDYFLFSSCILIFQIMQLFLTEQETKVQMNAHQACELHVLHYKTISSQV